MPRRKRRDKVNDFEKEHLTEQMKRLRRSSDDVILQLTPLRSHYNALVDLNRQMERSINMLNDRDPDYRDDRGHAYGLRQEVKPES